MKCVAHSGQEIKKKYISDTFSTSVVLGSLDGVVNVAGQKNIPKDFELVSLQRIPLVRAKIDLPFSPSF